MAKFKLEKQDVRLFLLSFIIGFVILATLIVLSCFNLFDYKIPVAYAIGFITGDFLHYLTIRSFSNSEVGNYKTMTYVLSILRKIIYVGTLIGIYLITRSVGAFLSNLGGTVTIKLVVLIYFLRGTKNINKEEEKSSN